MSSKRTRARNWRNDWPPDPWFYDSLFLAGQADCSPGENSVCGIFFKGRYARCASDPSSAVQLGCNWAANHVLAREQGLVARDDGKSLREEGIGLW